VVGWYGSVTTIVFGLIMISQGFQSAVYPIMVRYHKTDPEKLNFLFDESMFYLGALSLPMAMGLSLLSKPIILMIYKEQFLGAVLPLQIMAWLLVSEFLKVPNTRIMLVVEKQKHLVFFLIGSVGLNIMINIILDPQLGASGAAIARLSSSLAFLLVNMGYVARRVHYHNIFKILWKPLAATICMGAVILIIQDANLWFVIACGIIVYLVVLYLLRGLSEVEKVWIKSILNRARSIRRI
jgi:O-antigen/teichoic acid export membrane protein